MNIPPLRVMTDAEAQAFSKTAYAMFWEATNAQEQTLVMLETVCEQFDLLSDERDALAAELSALKMASA